MPSPTVVATSTVRDNAVNLRRFVDGNLAGGVDHLVVHVDGPVEVEVTALLDAHPHVTRVDADGDWWAGRRPERLNTRQRINANLTRMLFAATGTADWLLHLDGDEIAVLDREVVDGLEPEVTSIELETLECVAEVAPAGDPVLFKQRLEQPQLELLAMLGVIAEPHNRSYFKGHYQGRPGVRPGAGLWLGIHTAKDLRKEPVAGLTHPGLRVLHYESPSGEEFVRKWQALTRSGPGAVHHGGRAGLADNVRTLLALDIGTEVERELMLRLFASARADDVTTLRQLGMLVEVDPLRGTHVPRGLADGDSARLLDALARLRGTRKQLFDHPDHRERAEQAVLEAASGSQNS